MLWQGKYLKYLNSNNLCTKDDFAEWNSTIRKSNILLWLSQILIY